MQSPLVTKARDNRLKALALLDDQKSNVVSFADMQARRAGKAPTPPAFVSRRAPIADMRLAA